MQSQGIQLFKVGQDRRRGQLGKQRVTNAAALLFLLCFQAKAPAYGMESPPPYLASIAETCPETCVHNSESLMLRVSTEWSTRESKY